MEFIYNHSIHIRSFLEEINKKLKDPVIQKQLEPVLEDFRKQKSYDAKLNIIVVVGVPSILILVMFIGSFFQN